MKTARMLVSLSVLAASSMFSAAALADTTYSFTTISNGDQGVFYSPGYSTGNPSTPQGPLTFTWSVSDEYVCSISSGTSDTYVWFGDDCGALHDGENCEKWVVDTNKAGACESEAGYWEFDFWLLHGTDSFQFIGTIGNASWAGTNGLSLAGQYHGDQFEWMGATGFPVP